MLQLPSNPTLIRLTRAMPHSIFSLNSCWSFLARKGRGEALLSAESSSWRSSWRSVDCVCGCRPSSHSALIVCYWSSARRSHVLCLCVAVALDSIPTPDADPPSSTTTVRTKHQHQSSSTTRNLFTSLFLTQAPLNGDVSSTTTSQEEANNSRPASPVFVPSCDDIQLPSEPPPVKVGLLLCPCTVRFSCYDMYNIQQSFIFVCVQILRVTDALS